MPSAQRAREHQHAPVWRPGRTFIFPAIGDDALARSVWAHHPDAERAARLLRESDEIAARTPHGRAVLAAAEADAMYVRAIGIHHVHLLRTATIGLEDDLVPLGRIARRGVDGRIGGEARDGARAQIHRVNVG